jgi:transcriptional regulator with XRE-family HTH domain
MRSTQAKAVLISIGANVRRLRVRHDLTQERLAEAASIETRYLQDVERGRTNLSIDVLVALAESLGVDPRALLKPATLRPAKPGRPPKRRRDAGGVAAVAGAARAASSSGPGTRSRVTGMGRPPGR